MNKSFRKANLILTAAILVITGAITATGMRNASALTADGECEQTLWAVQECPPGTAMVYDSIETWSTCQTNRHGDCCQYNVHNRWCVEAETGTESYGGYHGSRVSIQNGPTCTSSGCVAQPG